MLIFTIMFQKRNESKRESIISIKNKNFDRFLPPVRGIKIKNKIIIILKTFVLRLEGPFENCGVNKLTYILQRVITRL